MSNTYEFLPVEEQLRLVIEGIASAEITLFTQNLNPTLNARLIPDTEAVLVALKAQRDDLCQQIQTLGVDPELVKNQIIRRSPTMRTTMTAAEMAEQEERDAQRDDAIGQRISAARERISGGGDLTPPATDRKPVA